MGNNNSKTEIQEICEEICALTDKVCAAMLNDEYAALSRKLTALLSSFSDSPLVRGKKEIWACGIVYALGQVNFLFDRQSSPYLSADDLCDAFGVKQSSAYQKALLIRRNLDMRRLDPEWCLPSLQDQNPYNWLIEVNGLMLDARYAPREIQEIAYEKGFIPYIPVDEKDDAPAAADNEKKPEVLSQREERERKASLKQKKKQQKDTEPDPSQLSLDF